MQLSPEIYQVLDERRAQDDKWGVQNHDPFAWLTILMEEVGEASEAVLEWQPDKYKRELVQVAAVAVAALECANRGFPSKMCSLIDAQMEIKRLRNELAKKGNP